jgi:hypothetical protein
MTGCGGIRRCNWRMWPGPSIPLKRIFAGIGL